MSRHVKIIRDPALPKQRPYGLPAPLPSSERILWQGSPAWRSVARRVLHVRALSFYFTLLFVVCAVRAVIVPSEAIEFSLVVLVVLGGVALGLLAVFAMLIARTTVYTVTDRRVVLRIGVALTASLNLPFRQIEEASVRLHADGTGDIPLLMSGETRIGWFMLWPHVRPWRTNRVQPMMRCVPEAGKVAEILSNALRDASEEMTSVAQTVSMVPATRLEVPLAATGD